MVPFSAMLDAGKKQRYEILRHICSGAASVDLAGNDEVEIKAVVAFRSFMRKAEKNTDGDRGCTCGL